MVVAPTPFSMAPQRPMHRTVAALPSCMIRRADTPVTGRIIRRVNGAVLAMSLLFALAPGCSSSNDGAEATRPLVVPDGCQPLLVDRDDGSHAPPPNGACFAPYPSDFHRAPDPKSATGFRLGLRGAARPVRANGETVDPHDVLAIDGASVVPTITAGLAGEIVRDGLPGVLDDEALSVRADSGTVVLDTSSGMLVPHYSDVVDKHDGTHTPITLRPFSPLRPRTRYVVAITGAHLAPSAGDGAKLAPPPEGFRRLRDGVAAGDPALAALASRFDAEVFAPLANAGVARDRLQLAWDFTTGSAEQPLADMLRVRELTLAWLAANEPQVRVTATRDGTGKLAKIFTIEVTTPLFLDQPGPGGRLVHDAAGQVVQNGTTTFTLVAVLPISVRDGSGPGRALAYGHGFFGNTDELESSAAQAISEHVSAVLFGTNWWGMSKDDIALVADTLTTHPEHFADFAERVHQAMANWLVALASIRGPLTKLPELRRASHEPFYDPSFVGYFGASMGHILGGTLAGLADFPRIVLNVGGGGFTHIMPRSLNFGPFGLLLGLELPDPLVAQSFAAIMQRSLDRIDPITYAPFVLASPLPGNATPDRRVLMQIGLGDPAVPNLASFLHARALGIAQAMPAPLSVFGLLPVADADAPSSLTVFDFHVDTAGYVEGKPISPNAVHEGVRVNPAALRQMEAFMKPGGAIVHTCDGPCDPE
ncbi:MAG: hypothetical protein QOI41_1221 [Myxococcales bacterium]|nr:hypothetical protein [Myxococcales bacterium]